MGSRAQAGSCPRFLPPGNQRNLRCDQVARKHPILRVRQPAKPTGVPGTLRFDTQGAVTRMASGFPGPSGVPGTRTGCAEGRGWRPSSCASDSAGLQPQGWVCMQEAHPSSQGSVETAGVSQGSDRSPPLLCSEAFLKEALENPFVPSWHTRVQWTIS